MNINEEYNKYLTRMNEYIENGEADPEEVISFEEYSSEINKFLETYRLLEVSKNENR